MHFVDTFFVVQRWPYINQTYQFIKNSYLKSNCGEIVGTKLFSLDCSINMWINFDGIYQLTRSSIQLGFYEWDTFVQSVCNDYLHYILCLF